MNSLQRILVVAAVAAVVGTVAAFLAPWQLAALVSWGATYGGTLVFDYGFNVETAGDSPVWHKSEEDVRPGKH